MKKIITTLSAAIIASNASAAIITTDVVGVMGDWFLKSGLDPQVLQENFLVGNPDIQVAGTLSYDDVTEELTALSLYQVGSLVNATVDGNTMTISDLSWELGLGYTIIQLSGSANCSIVTARCSEMAAAISLSDSNSPFNFDGVAEGFEIDGVEQVWSDGYIETIGAPEADFAIHAIADQYLGSGNAITDITFQLNVAPVVPVPAAAWLMGSALVGLTGIARRRRA
jgi:hypothetical protein